MKILSCSLGKIEQNWTSIKVFNRTNYEIFDVTSNSQYIIQVLVDDEDTSTIQHKNIAYILTSATCKIQIFTLVSTLIYTFISYDLF